MNRFDAAPSNGPCGQPLTRLTAAAHRTTEIEADM